MTCGLASKTCSPTQRRDLGGVAAVLVHRHERRDADGVAGDLVVLAEAGRHVDDAGALLGRHEVGAEDLERPLGAEALGVGEEVEQRPVAGADELGAAHRRRPARRRRARRRRRRRRSAARTKRCAVVLDDGVVDVGADGEGEVGRQRPRRRRPRQQPGARPRSVEQLEADRQRRVLAVAVDVVHPRLGVAERGLAAPAVGQHAEALVDQALVPERLEGPHDALHVVEVEGLVVVLEVDPAGLAARRSAPTRRCSAARSCGRRR